MEKDSEITKVIFRFWNESKDVIAIFPEYHDGVYGIACYEHVGQHSYCDYFGVRDNSRLATEDEYKDLYEELESIGYNLKVMKRFPSWRMDVWRHCND